MAKLYVVATPIGNLGDLTERMRQALEECDLIAAEDTRVTMKLLNHFDKKKPMISCHRHNEDTRAPALISRMLEEDITVALTCDAGTPAISDPGHVIVAAAWEAGVEVVPISGPSATVTALSAAGFDAREFAFYGFLPREKKALREKLEAIRDSGIPVAVIYESPHRVEKLIAEMAEAWPGQRACVCCDLTKRYEKILRGTLEYLSEKLAENPNTEKGEYCVVAEVPPAAEKAEAAESDAAMFMLRDMLGGADISEAADAAAAAGYPRNEIYRAKLEIKKRFEE
nr:TIGR00096: putative S-adenosylmethionine-dependent methyltransferase, YraL family [uncultured bacterium]